MKKSDVFSTYVEYNLTHDDIANDVSDDMVLNIVSNLSQGKNVLVHTADLKARVGVDATEEEIEKNSNFISLITEYLAELTLRIKERSEAIFIFIGGETSYKSCAKIGATRLELIDNVTSEIPLCLDSSGQWVVTKSGNLGDINTIVEVVKYFER